MSSLSQSVNIVHLVCDATIPGAGVDGSRKVDVKEGGEEVEKTGLKQKEIQSLLLSIFFSFSFFFWLYHEACGTLVPQPGIDPMPLALEAQS